MSATQHVFPLSKVLTSGAGESWLEGQGLTRPTGWERSRYPTARELRAALTSLDGHYMAEFIEGDDLRFWFHVDSDPESTEIYLEGYAGARDDDAPLGMHFDKGSGAWQLQVEIVERLTHSCGPMLIAEHEFIVVEPGTARDAPWHCWPEVL